MEQRVLLSGGSLGRHFQEQMIRKTCFLPVLYDYDCIMSTQGGAPFNCRWSAAPSSHKIFELADFYTVPFLCHVFITTAAPTFLHVITVNMKCAQLSPA
jgi:hypothetical protein